MQLKINATIAGILEELTAPKKPARYDWSKEKFRKLDRQMTLALFAALFGFFAVFAIYGNPHKSNRPNFYDFSDVNPKNADRKAATAEAHLFKADRDF